MGKVIASVALGSVVVVLVFLMVAFVEMQWGIGQALGAVQVEDPYRMHRMLKDSLSSFAYATAALLYYALGGSVLIDRWSKVPRAAATKSAVLALVCWLIAAVLSAWQVGVSVHVTLRLAAIVAIPMFLGTYAMLRVMPSNTSFERTRGG